MTWNPPSSYLELAFASTVETMPLPRAREVGIHRTELRTQLPIHKSIKSLVHHVTVSVPLFRGHLPRLEGRRTIGHIWLPGRSRDMADNARLDAHQTGLAADFMASDIDSTLSVTVLANYLLRHAAPMGLQRIIWDGMTFDCDRKGADRWHVYKGASMHRDHIHVEVSYGSYGLPWYRTHP